MFNHNQQHLYDDRYGNRLSIYMDDKIFVLVFEQQKAIDR